jgi:ankyrin repeat protein
MKMTTHKRIPEALGDALADGDFAEFRKLMLAHPEQLRDASGKDEWLYLSAQLGQLEFVTFLVALGIGVNEPLDDGPDGAILRAANEGHVDVARWFLDHGATINHIIEGKNTCFSLTGAIVGGHLAMVKLLVGRGADVNYEWGGMTPLSYALAYKQTEIAAYLRSIGARVPSQPASVGLPSSHKEILAHFTKHRGKPSELALRAVLTGDRLRSFQPAQLLTVS